MAVYIWNIVDYDPTEEELSPALPREEVETIRRIGNPDEKKRRIASRLLLFRILAFERSDFHRAAGAPVLERDSWGRPYLPGHPELSCGISHSGDYVMCGTAPQRDGIGLGVDIEGEISTDWREIGLMTAPEEKEMLSAVAESVQEQGTGHGKEQGQEQVQEREGRRQEHLQERSRQKPRSQEQNRREQQRELFSLLWVCKEAYLKALGYGLSLPPSEVALEISPLTGASDTAGIEIFTDRHAGAPSVKIPAGAPSAKKPPEQFESRETRKVSSTTAPLLWKAKVARSPYAKDVTILAGKIGTYYYAVCLPPTSLDALLEDGQIGEFHQGISKAFSKSNGI